MNKRVLCHHSEEVSRMISEGVAYSAIARHFEVDPSTVREYCMRHGLTLSEEQIRKNAKDNAKRLEPYRHLKGHRGGGRKRWTTDISELEDLIADGMTTKELVEYYGVCDSTLRKFMRSHNLVAARRNIEKEYADVAKMYESGMSVAEIARELERPLSTIYLWLGKAGVGCRGNVPVLKQHHEAIQRDIYDGYTIAAVAKKYRCNLNTTRLYIRQHIDYPEELKQTNINRAVELNRNTEAEVKAKIAQANPFIEYVGGYTRSQDPVTVRCLVCGQTYETTFSTITHKGGSNCPYCKEAERIEREQRRQAEAEAKAEERERDRLLKRLANILETKAKQDARWHDCPVCGKRTNRQKYCSDRCRRRALNKRKEITRRARIAEQMVDKDITLESLYKRDKGVCHICGGKCDYEDYVVSDQAIICGDWYPSIDHVIPLSKGGEHSWGNVRLAHRICNSKKSNRCNR